MDDQSLDDFVAGLFSDLGQGSESPPAESPSSLSLQDAPTEVRSTPIETVQASGEPVISSDPTEVTEPQVAPVEQAAVSPEYLAYVESMQKELADRRFADEQARRLIAQQQRQERDQRINSISQQLGEWDPELQKQFLQGHQSLNTELIEVHQEVGKLNSVLEAVTLALEHEFDEGTVDHVVERAKSLMHLPHEARVETLSREREVIAAANQENERLKARNAELEARLSSKERDPMADRVEGSPVSPATRDWEKAERFDDWFDGWYSSSTAVA